MKSFFKEHNLIVCMGTGGVGKTTISAALAVLAAQQGFRTLVLTIDPARRLAQVLGVENRPGVEVAVQGAPGLSACMIDPGAELNNFVSANVESKIAEGLFNNPLYKQLVGNLTGSQEFTSLVRVHHSVYSGKYDVVILDTPPAQNSVDFLRAPEQIYALFQESVIRWFAPKEKANWMNRLVNRGTSLVTVALERVTGTQFITELKDFFSHLSYLQHKVSQTSMEMHKLLHDRRTGFFLVTGFDETKLKEAMEFQIELGREELNLSAVIVNRAFPVWAPESSQEVPPELVSLYEQMAHYFKERIALYEKFAQQVGRPLPILKLPDYNRDMVGMTELELLGQQLREKWEKENA